MRTSRYLVALCSLLFFSFLVYASVRSEKKMFKVVIGEYEGKKGSMTPQLICLMGNGRFLGWQGENVSDENIKEYLSTFLMDGRANLLLRFDNEKSASILDLTKVLSRLKNLANPKIETTVYIEISGI